MEFDECITKIQKYVENAPMVILGSGASAAYGLPTMQKLNEKILANESCFNVDDESVKAFLEDIRNGIDLETAFKTNYQVDLNGDFTEKIVHIVWEYISEADRKFFNDGLQNNFTTFKLKDLLNKILATSNNEVNIVTTNYDRLAEYAADLNNATIETGFEGMYYKNFIEITNMVKKKRIHERERVVKIWKVHGSLDWFIAPNGIFVSLPMGNEIIDNYKPQIIMPSVKKYQMTAQEPYRTMINNADNSVVNSKSFLAIGYGFNDDHIQPKIIEQVKQNKPIVVITKKATQACIDAIKNTGSKKFAIIEKGDTNNSSKVTMCDGIYSYDKDIWSIEGFMANIW